MISIVIASKNKDDLERCQRSIAETIGVEYEVLVTENSKGMIPQIQFTTNNHDDFGFRLAYVPEPSTIALAAIGLVSLIACAWRRRRV